MPDRHYHVIFNPNAGTALTAGVTTAMLGEMFAAAVASLGLEPAVRVTSIGVAELPECGTNDEVLAYHGLDVEGLARQIRAAGRLQPAPTGSAVA